MRRIHWVTFLIFITAGVFWLDAAFQWFGGVVSKPHNVVFKFLVDRHAEKLNKKKQENPYRAQPNAFGRSSAKSTGSAFDALIFELEVKMSTSFESLHLWGHSHGGFVATIIAHHSSKKILS